jgi:pilus assembly protein Flp/PilA
MIERGLARLAHGRARDRGATATEYAMLVGFVALVIVAGVTFFGEGLDHWFHSLGSSISPFSS